MIVWLTEQEPLSAILLAAGLICLFLAQVWVGIVSWKVSWKWGLGLAIFPPAALVFVPKYFSRLKRPVALAAVAAVLIGIPFAVNAVMQRVDLGPRERVVDGELHITLTGWDHKDYSILRNRPAVAVLQMANPDVTDVTLEQVRGFQQLKELDLNDTQITDAGLSILDELPLLASLRLRGTKITDEGFQRALSEKETLMELDVRDTEIASKTIREWKNAKDGRKYLK